MMSKTRLLTLIIIVFVLFLPALLWAGAVYAVVVLEFEAPLPGNLQSMTYIQGNPVPANSVITDQYSNFGILFNNVAIVSLGAGHAPSGVNGIVGINSNNYLDYSIPLEISFVSPLNSDIKAVTDYFSITTDNWGESGNSITVSGYSLGGDLLGSTSYTEGSGGITLQLSNIGDIHTVIVASTLSDPTWGGIGFDSVKFANVTPPHSESSGDGLVAYWSFDNCDANDDSGNGHNGTIYGNPQCVDGEKGKAFRFDGFSDWIDVGPDTYFPAVTVSAFIKLDSTTTPSSTADGAITVVDGWKNRENFLMKISPTPAHF